MDSTGANAVDSEQKEIQSQPSSMPAYVSMVDPFLVEALQNPRHRLTILRMELDIQNFLRNPDQNQFEFPHFPASYLRFAAHRVAQHYGLQTMVQDNVVDGHGNKILVIKKPESKFPSVCLSDVPAKELENDKLDHIKVVIRPRPKASSNNTELALKRNQVRTFEEREQEYERARARIFNNGNNAGSEGSPGQASSETEKLCIDDNEVSRNLGADEEKGIWNGETINTSRVAILRDREKDRTDPDYDRSYDRYARSIPSNLSGQSFNMAPFHLQPPFVQYDPGFPRRVQTPPPQAPLNHSIPVLSPYSITSFNQNSGEALYMQWPTQSMMYAQSFDQLRHGFFQAPFYQQPLSFDYSQNYHR